MEAKPPSERGGYFYKHPSDGGWRLYATVSHGLDHDNITAWRYVNDDDNNVASTMLPCLVASQAGTGIPMVTDGVPTPRLYLACSDGSTFEYDLPSDTLRMIDLRGIPCTPKRLTIKSVVRMATLM